MKFKVKLVINKIKYNEFIREIYLERLLKWVFIALVIFLLLYFVI